VGNRAVPWVSGSRSRIRCVSTPHGFCIQDWIGKAVEVRLSNQQRHTISAVLLSVVIVLVGFALLDIRQAPDDPLRDFVGASGTTDTSGVLAVNNGRRSSARSSSGFVLTPEVSSTSTSTLRSDRSATVVADETSKAGETTTSSLTTTQTASTAATSTATTTVLDGTTTVESTVTITTIPTTVTSAQPTTTVEDDGSDTTRKCRGNGKNKCRDNQG